jgi:hypothetical protein
VILLTVVGVLTSLFFFASGEVYGTIIFHNLPGVQVPPGERAAAVRARGNFPTGDPELARLPEVGWRAIIRSMRYRFRVVAALLALFALSLGFVETTWAACAGDHPARDSAAVQHVHESPAAHHDTESAPTPHAPHAPQSAPDCPLPASAMAACGMLSLPGAAAALHLPLTTVTETGIAAEQAVGRLVVSSLFRPPQR